MKIAVIGTGIAGLGAAHALGRLHEVELFEAAERAGGHAHTVTHDSLELDTGFIVHNEANYPQLTRLFRELGVETQPSEMSFAMSCGCGLEWSSKRPWRAGPAIAARDPALSPHGRHGRHGRQVVRPLPPRRGLLGVVSVALPRSDDVRALVDGTAGGARLSRPRTGSSSSANHSMLGLRRSRWRTVTGGSRTYVRALLERLGAPVHLATPVRSAAAHGRRSRSSRTGDGADAQLRGRRRRDERSARARPARGSFGRRAGDPLRLRVDCERDRPPHGRGAPAGSSVEPLVVELPVARLRGLRRPAVDHVLAQPAAAAGGAGRVLRHAQPHRRHRSRRR